MDSRETDPDTPRRTGMTLRGYILFGLAMYVAMTAGILVATSGREKLLAAAISLAIVGPMWMLGRRGWVRPYPDDTPPRDDNMMKPQISMIIYGIGICSTVWSVPRYYQRGEWMGVFVYSFMFLFFLHGMYLAKQRWNKRRVPN